MQGKKHRFCCNSMWSSITKYKTIDYTQFLRTYGILIGNDAIRMLSFCPWCGKKLPEELTSTICDVIEREFNVSEANIFDPNLPEEFRTDEWWRKRGL